MKKPLYKMREPEELSPKRKVNVVVPGMVFGEWTVLKRGVKPDYLLCVCSCGTEREVHVYSLYSKKSSSCGCRRKRSPK